MTGEGRKEESAMILVQTSQVACSAKDVDADANANANEDIMR